MPVLGQVLVLCLASAAFAIPVALLRGVPDLHAGSTGAPAGTCAAPDGLGLVPATDVRWISQAEARALLGDGAAQFVDCRPRDQFHSGHVSGSISVPDETEVSGTAIELLSVAPTVITYCDAAGGCARSQRIAVALRSLGLPDVRVLEGGLPTWLDNGYPAESGSCRLCPTPN